MYTIRSVVDDIAGPQCARKKRCLPPSTRKFQKVAAIGSGISISTCCYMDSFTRAIACNGYMIYIYIYIYRLANANSSSGQNKSFDSFDILKPTGKLAIVFLHQASP